MSFLRDPLNTNNAQYCDLLTLMGVCVPRPSSLGPSALGSHLVGSWPQKYCKNKFMNKAYCLFKIKTFYLFKIFKKLFRKTKLWCPK